MGELHAHLHNRPADVFPSSELNYIILMVYNFLTAALRDGCDALRFTARDVSWLREGLPVGQFPESSKQTMTFRTAMERILARDEVVRKHLRRVAETPDEVTYRITDDVGTPQSLAEAAGRARADD